MNAWKTCSLVAALLAAPTLSQAQNYEWKLVNNAYPYQIGLNLPAACDQKVLSGFAHWNGASRFSTTQSGRFFSGFLNPASTDIQIQMEPASRMVSGAINLAEAPPGTFIRWITVDGTSVRELRSAHVRVNADYWASGEFHCGPNPVPFNTFDFAYVVAHEVGHVLGVGHGTPTLPQSCVMGIPLARSVPLPARCALETTRARNLYGTP